MFVGHLPGAYLIFRVVTPRIERMAFTAAMLGAIAPDLDMLRFYFVDGRAFHHHEYLTHRPILWTGLLLCGVLIGMRSRRIGVPLAFFGAGGLVHMLLDSIAGKIAWAWPVSDFAAPLVVVPATQSHWILSFLSHWTFAVELGITVLALVLWRWRPRRATARR